MCRTSPIYPASDRLGTDQVPVNSIGDLFRDHGEAYIQRYAPCNQQIKLIRAIRLCKTPALGASVIICKDCGHKHYIFHSCGHSHCMLCQSVKREQWVDKLKATLLKVPYVHSVFTLPHQLNGLARSNEATIYGIILRSAWETIKVLGQRKFATPGMTSILHTFGSDMKYHIHVHALVTFGGLSSSGDWIYPEHKHRIHKYRVICATFRDTFLRLLYKQLLSGKLSYHLPIMPLLAQVQKIRWVVHCTRPTMDTTIIEQYLAKYINRVAVSNKRLNYLKDTNQVVLVYNDYKKQLTGQPAPKAFKTMSPLLAINQILQHVLPPYFQKSRRYGLHNSSSNVRKNIPDAVKRNPLTIRTVFEIITTLLQIKPYYCEVCGSINYELDNLLPDQTWIFTFISIEPRSPPQATETITLQTAKTTDMQS